jgi:rhamnogalacturonyl hydrolase YesR
MIKRIVVIVFFFHNCSDGIGQPASGPWPDRINIIEKNIKKFFYDEATGYYKEKTVRKPDDKPYSYLWPLCGLIQAANEVEAYTKRTGFFDTILKNIQAYYDPAAPAASYGSYIIKEKKDDRFYDDNQWVGIASLDAYERTKNTQYLEQGLLVYRFMMTGFDTVSGGGLYWKEKDYTTKNTCSNGPGVLVALQLYNATGNKTYLDTAILLYNWTKKNLLSPEAVYYDNIQLPSGKIDKKAYAYNTGTMLQSSAMLYGITKEKKYLQHAQELAEGSLKKFFIKNRFPGHYWFNVVLLRGYIDLYKIDGERKFIKAMEQEAEAIWQNEKDNNNLLGKKDSKELLDQAAVMEMFARLAAVSWDKSE